MNELPRPDPDALLRTLALGKGSLLAGNKAGHGENPRGRLKVFLGAAPGVGKTCEMLDDAAGRLKAGIDVAIGLVETHGRLETVARTSRILFLERIYLPRRKLLKRF